jgi:hypothetical protein
MAEKQTHPRDKKSDSSSPNVRSASMRKEGKDPGWTPSELHKRNRLMKQFCRSGRKGVEVSSGNSEAYMDGWERIFGKKDE